MNIKKTKLQWKNHAVDVGFIVPLKYAGWQIMADLYIDDKQVMAPIPTWTSCRENRTVSYDDQDGTHEINLRSGITWGLPWQSYSLRIDAEELFDGNAAVTGWWLTWVLGVPLGLIVGAVIGGIIGVSIVMILQAIMITIGLMGI